MLSTSELVPDALWAFVQPLLPAPKRRRKHHPGRKPVSDRAAFTVIVFILKTGLPWRMVPRELGCSGPTAWRRLKRWQHAGVFRQLKEVLLAMLNARGELELETAIIDSATARALLGGEATGHNPTDRGKRGTKHHVMTDGTGAVLSSRVTGANVHDVTQALLLVDHATKIRGRRGRPHFRPALVFGDRGYDSEPLRRALRHRGITPHLARRRTPHGSTLGRVRWVVERTLAWKHDHRRLLIRLEKLEVIHQAFNTLSDAIICWNLYHAATAF